jgi:hypothetical protein
MANTARSQQAEAGIPRVSLFVDCAALLCPLSRYTLRDRVLRLLISENYGCFLMQRSDGGELGRSKSNTGKFTFSLHESASGPKAAVPECLLSRRCWG